MLMLFNSLGKQIEPFEPVRKDLVTMFTCGPSVYQRAHIGNFRTFLFEDVLVRYLELLGHVVKRGMNFTDVEDKAILEAQKRGMSVQRVTDEHIGVFLQDMELVRIKKPDYLPRASETVEEAVELIRELLAKKVAYRHRENIYFDPLKFDGFGRLYGLDMSQWPATRKRFHKDTYPGMRWNLGDFVLWHGYKEGDLLYWDTAIGRGRPSWNIEDPSMIGKHFTETLSVYCGGIDNLFRHHDYTMAILESVRPYPVARYWLHGHHLVVNGKKMSKSRGNIHYISTLREGGYTAEEIRFFLIYGHYRKVLNYSTETMAEAVSRLREFKRLARRMSGLAGDLRQIDDRTFESLRSIFKNKMDQDLDLQGAFDGVHDFMARRISGDVTPAQAGGALKALKEMDHVLQVIF